MSADSSNKIEFIFYSTHNAQSNSVQSIKTVASSLAYVKLQGVNIIE